MTRILPVSVSHSTPAIGNPLAMTPRTKRAAVVFLKVVGPRANFDRCVGRGGAACFFTSLPPVAGRGENVKFSLTGLSLHQISTNRAFSTIPLCSRLSPQLFVDNSPMSPLVG